MSLSVIETEEGAVLFEVCGSKLGNTTVLYAGVVELSGGHEISTVRNKKCLEEQVSVRESENISKDIRKRRDYKEL